jgi:hypothetical protein
MRNAILKSPVIGFSDSVLRCAEEMAAVKETAQTIDANNNSLTFMITTPWSELFFGGNEEIIKKFYVTQDGSIRGVGILALVSQRPIRGISFSLSLFRKTNWSLSYMIGIPGVFCSPP